MAMAFADTGPLAMEKALAPHESAWAWPRRLHVGLALASVWRWDGGMVSGIDYRLRSRWSGVEWTRNARKPEGELGVAGGGGRPAVT